MILDTTVVQSKTAANLIEFINMQTNLIELMYNNAKAPKWTNNIIKECHIIIHETKLINARQQSALGMVKERSKGGRNSILPERRSNGRIKF